MQLSSNSRITPALRLGGIEKSQKKCFDAFAPLRTFRGMTPWDGLQLIPRYEMTTWDGLAFIPKFGNDNLGWAATDPKRWNDNLGWAATVE
eukprot:2227754-Amphidinium_carterae.1